MHRRVARSPGRRESAALHRFPLFAVAAVVILTAAAAWFSWVDRGLVVNAPVPEPAAWFVAVQAASALVWATVSLALRRRRDLAWSGLTAIASLSHAGAGFCYAWAVHGLVAGGYAPGAEVAAALALILLPVEMPVSIYLLASLPSGRLTRAAGWDRVGWVAVLMATAGVVVEFLSDPDVAGTTFASARNPFSLELPHSPFVALLIAPAAVIATVVVVAKWRRSSGDDRLALRLVVWTQVAGTVVVVGLVATVSPEVSVGVAQLATALGLVVLVAVVRREHLFGVERFFERALRFSVLVGILTLVYSLVVAAGSEMLGSAARPLAAAGVALAALPLRDRVAVGVARIIYGERANSVEIVRGVAEQAASALSPQELVERFLTDLVQGTGAGAAWIEVDDFGTLAAVGNPPTKSPGMLPSAIPHSQILRVALAHRGRSIGSLCMIPGDGDLALDSAGERVANELSPHIAMMADAYLTDIELQVARRRLIAAREEERRRLRHDLHDGLGPILTGVAFSADAASNLIASDPEAAAELIAASRRNVTLALDEIRRIVEDLRPPALDELGLAGAIRQHAQRLPQLEVAVTGELPRTSLPAAVEVAAYRIATEALTNVARHARACGAAVDLSLNGALVLSVTDNGPGSDQWVRGVGLSSMESRARELGGSLSAGPIASGGGAVVATLPIDAE